MNRNNSDKTENSNLRKEKSVQNHSSWPDWVALKVIICPGTAKQYQEITEERVFHFHRYVSPGDVIYALAKFQLKPEIL